MLLLQKLMPVPLPSTEGMQTGLKTPVSRGIAEARHTPGMNTCVSDTSPTLSRSFDVSIRALVPSYR